MLRYPGNYYRDGFGWGADMQQRAPVICRCSACESLQCQWLRQQGSLFFQQRQEFQPWMTNQEMLENLRPQPKSKEMRVSFPPQRPLGHTTLYSLQKRRNRIQNPLLRAKLLERQVYYNNIRQNYYDQYQGAYYCYPFMQQFFPVHSEVGQPIANVLSADREFRKYLREQARRKQIKDSIVFQKRKLLRSRANVIHCKKLKRLQRDERPLRRFRYNLWQNVKGERDDIRRGRKIIRNRRKGRMSSPEECTLWNCPRKIRRKGRANRRFPNSPQSISSVDRRPRSRSRTPIRSLRDTPLAI